VAVARKVLRNASRTSANSIPLPGHFKALVAIALAWVAGFADVVSWLVLAHIYTSHMTGNTASFSLNLSRDNMVEALGHLWPIVPFVAGLIYSASTTAIARRRGFHSSFAIALATQVVLLIAFVALGTSLLSGADLSSPPGWRFNFLICLPAAAMGIQTVTVTRVAGLRVYTTYLTGSLAKFAEAVVHYLLWVYDRTRGRFRRRIGLVMRISLRRDSVKHALLTSGLWFGFATGALCGALAEERYGLMSLLAPTIVMAATLSVDLIRPVAAADEPHHYTS